MTFAFVFADESLGANPVGLLASAFQQVPDMQAGEPLETLIVHGQRSRQLPSMNPHASGLRSGNAP